MTQPTNQTRSRSYILTQTGEQIPVDVKRSGHRKKSITVKVLEDVVTVLAPSFASSQDIQQVLRKHQDWITDTWDKQSAKRKAFEVPCDIDSPQIGMFWYRGVQVKAVFHPCTRKRWAVEHQNDTLVLFGPAPTIPKSEAVTLIRGWLVREAKKELTRLLEQWAHHLQLSYHQLRVKDQRGRWGSCSAKRNINLNWRLICAPEYAMEYVIVHELCHLLEMNHSPAFWKLVKDALPTYQSGQRWLKQHGQELFHQS